MTTLRQRLSTAGSRYAAARESLRERATPYVGIDPRALGAFRIALALIVLGDLLVYRVPGVGPFYTDDGVLPTETLAETYPLLETVSIHAASGAAWVQTSLLAVTACAAVCLLVGYRTRTAAGVSAVLLGSLYARNPYVLNGGNTILVAFLFFGLFLPLDARWSLGAGRPNRGSDRDETGSPADGDERRDASRRGDERSDDGRDDDGRDDDGRDGGRSGADERGSGVERRVCSLGTAVTLLTFVSIYAANAVAKYRSDAWLSGIAVPQIFQIGEIAVRLGPFLSEYTALLTAVNWLWIALLSTAVLLIAPVGRLRTGVALAFVSAHLGMAATMRLAAFPFVMVAILLLFFPPGAWDAVEAVASRVPGVSRITERAYRSDGGKATATPSPTPSRVRRGARVGGAILLVGVFLTLLGWQAVGVGVVDIPESEPAGGLSEMSWSFFAPNPPDSSSWYVVRATLESGESVDLRDGGTVSFDRPPDAADTYPTTLWHQYGFRLRYAGDSRYRSVATYACERTDRPVESVTVFHVDQEVGSTGPVGDPTAEERASVAC